MTGNYEKRFFTAVQGDDKNKGELFGTCCRSTKPRSLVLPSSETHLAKRVLCVYAAAVATLLYISCSFQLGYQPLCARVCTPPAGVKNMFELHAGVKTKDIIDNQEASSSQQQKSLYRIVEYNTGEEMDEAGNAAAPAGNADEDVAAAGLQHVAGILEEMLVGSQANPKPKFGRGNGAAADVEMAEEEEGDGEDDGMLALTRAGTSQEEPGFQVSDGLCWITPDLRAERNRSHARRLPKLT